jgi:hypothetical protein
MWIVNSLDILRIVENKDNKKKDRFSASPMEHGLDMILCISVFDTKL